MVVERSAKEYALSRAGCLFGELEPENLEQYGAGFGYENDADDGEEKACLNQDEHNADGCSESDRTCIAHVDFSGRAVEPKVGKQ